MRYQIKKFPSVDCDGDEIPIEIHCDSGGIMAKAGRRAHIGICGFPGQQITDAAENVEFRQGIDVSWLSN